jgi:hypothetical protein
VSIQRSGLRSLLDAGNGVNSCAVAGGVWVVEVDGMF